MVRGQKGRALVESQNESESQEDYVCTEVGDWNFRKSLEESKDYYLKY